MGVFCILSFLIEKAAAKGLDGYILFVLVFINLFLSLAWPMAMSFILKPEFLLGNLMSLCSVSLFLKLFSYHHVLLDVRILNKRIAKYKKEKSEMLKPNQIEGTILGVKKITYDQALKYPEFLEFFELMRFVFSPTFCFQLVYPLAPSIDWKEVIYRIYECSVCVFLLFYLGYQHILPVAAESVVFFEERDIFSILLATLNLSIPVTYFWLTSFFLIFHSFSNLSAELTRFQDRRFYQDWWNSGSLTEYWRKWNHPIHNWLVRHCYYPLVRRGIDTNTARFLTFMVSAYFHEHITVATFRFCNGVAFFFMIVNVPLM